MATKTLVVDPGSNSSKALYELNGNAADRPVAPTNPMVFYATDTGAFSLWTGSAWVPLTTPPSFSPSNDNTTDLGDSTHRFRVLYLGTGIVNSSSVYAQRDDATNNAVSTVLALRHINPAPSALNVGVGLDFEVNLAAGDRIIGSVQSRWISNTAANPNSMVALRAANLGTLHDALQADCVDVGDICLRVRAAINGQPVQIRTHWAGEPEYDFTHDGPINIHPSGQGEVYLTVNGNERLRANNLGVRLSGLFGIYGTAPAVQPAPIGNPAGGGTVDAEARAAIDSILAALRSWGGIAT